jgi:hypothetical protein
MHRLQNARQINTSQLTCFKKSLKTYSQYRIVLDEAQRSSISFVALDIPYRALTPPHLPVFLNGHMKTGRPQAVY